MFICLLMRGHCPEAARPGKVRGELSWRRLGIRKKGADACCCFCLCALGRLWCCWRNNVIINKWISTKWTNVKGADACSDPWAQAVPNRDPSILPHPGIVCRICCFPLNPWWPPSNGSAPNCPLPTPLGAQALVIHPPHHPSPAYTRFTFWEFPGGKLSQLPFVLQDIQPSDIRIGSGRTPRCPES